ncbi:MAG: hypothetical protein ACK5YR_14365 [Pirellula sp.]|jgi:hypothetical protein
MFWALELPVKITFWILVAVVVLVMIVGNGRNWAPLKSLAIISSVVFIGFVPSCAIVMRIVDAQRFGLFQYASYSDVQDFRVERFLPPAAQDITLEKTFIGHRAKYTISESELRSYLDGHWNAYGKYSAIPRSDLKDGESVMSEEIEDDFQGLNWPRMGEAIRFHSPVEHDGGGATYYFDPVSGTTYHRAGYW